MGERSGNTSPPPSVIERKKPKVNADQVSLVALRRKNDKKKKKKKKTDEKIKRFSTFFSFLRLGLRELKPGQNPTLREERIICPLKSTRTTMATAFAAGV